MRRTIPSTLTFCPKIYPYKNSKITAKEVHETKIDENVRTVIV